MALFFDLVAELKLHAGWESGLAMSELLWITFITSLAVVCTFQYFLSVADYPNPRIRRSRKPLRKKFGTGIVMITIILASFSPGFAEPFAPPLPANQTTVWQLALAQETAAALAQASKQGQQRGD